MAAQHELARLDLPLVHRGKVRDIYAVDDEHLLFIASDRLSAFDVVMAEPVPDKGRVLTALSVFWFDRFEATVANHLVTADQAAMPPAARRAELTGRTLLVRRAEMLPIECVVRGYLAGSAWKEYRESGTVHGEALVPGLVEAAPLPEPIFTPATKATTGHDVNIPYAAAEQLVGAELAARAKELSLHLFAQAATHAASRGIILADTKFELGVVEGELVVADELLTPDSSRFWPAEGWEPGTTPPSFDKQPVRDHLDALSWDKQPPPPPLPGEVVAATAARYREAYERLTGLALADWPGVQE
jgi:phosphoribosylaminoimidazole-succinocarboxamide synthase